MTPERWQHLKQLYEEAATLTPDRQRAFLAEVGAADSELRREIELMLAAEKDSAFMNTPAPEQEARATALLGRGALLGRRLGHYQVLELLGAGAMGDVYLAQDLQLERRIALKVLPAEFTREPQRLQRFIREAKAASALNHPNIITIHEIGAERPESLDGLDSLDGPGGEDADDIHFIAAEFIEGVTLRQRLAEGPLPVRAALDVTLQITAALAAAHQAGIIHRDIKPENVMVRPDGLVKVLDFGLAKLTETRGTDALGSTGHGVVLGTPRYMSPEQARGQDVDARTDIFSCGALLHELLSGRPAFQRETMAETMAAILKEDPPELVELSQTNKQVSPQLARIVRHCLEKKPEMRFQSARDLGFALEALSIPSGPSGARPAEWLEPVALPAVTKSVGKTRLFGNARLAWMVAAALLIGMLGVALAYFRRAPAESHLTYNYLPLPEQTSSAINHGSALSPDGRRVVMVAVTAEVTRLWLYSFERAAPELLPGTEEAHYPFWSPNGRSIGFFAQGKLKRIETSGGMPTTLCDASGGAGESNGIGGAWSSTGVILFAPQFNGAGLYRISESGGTAIPVTSLDAARFETGHNHPSFLPDGRHFVFFTQAGQPDYRGIRLGSLDSPLLPLKTSFLLRADTKAEYSAAGYLLFVRGRKILAQKFDPDQLILGGDPAPVTESVHYEPPYRYADLSVVNHALLYRRGGNPNNQLIWFDRGGRQLAAVFPAGEYHSLQLSPDGRQILLDRNDPQLETSDIWQFDLLRETRKRLTLNPAVETYPIWSPDGSRMAFVSNREGVWELYQKALSGDDKEELLLKGDQQLLLTSDWSPDGKFIVYRKYQKTGIDLELLPLSGDRQRRNYLATPFDESYGKVSPDGRWLAYQSDNSGRMEINVQSFPEPGRRVTISRGGGILPRWRSDGKELYYVAADDKLMAVPVETGASFLAGTPVALFEMGSFGRVIGRYVYDVSADGRKFLVIRPHEDASMRPLTVVRNWTTLLKK